MRVGPIAERAAEARVRARVADDAARACPMIVPSRLQPSSTYCTCPRPCGIAIRFSERVSTHFTGRCSRRAAAIDHAVLGREAGLAAERAADVRRDDTNASLVEVEHRRRALARTPCGICVDTYTVRSWPSPSSPGTDGDRVAFHRHHRDALVLDPRPHDDVGVGEHVVARCAAVIAAARFEPSSSNCSGASGASAASGSTTAGSGS